MIRRILPLAIAFAIAAVAFLAMPQRVNEHRFANEMSALKAISAIHIAQSQYQAANGHYAATLAALDLPDHLAGFRFTLRPTPSGYELLVAGSMEQRSYYSSDDMTIHQHNGPGQASAGDPILGQRIVGKPGRY
jgi:hypothetical protein